MLLAWLARLELAAGYQNQTQSSVNKKTYYVAYELVEKRTKKSMASPSYTTCYTYNISTTNTNITRDDLQNAFQIGVISPAGIAYRWTFGCVYLVVLGWSSWQYGVHGLNKKLWLDNRQIVVLCILVCALLRALQFLLKAVTDCQNECLDRWGLGGW